MPTRESIGTEPRASSASLAVSPSIGARTQQVWESIDLRKKARLLDLLIISASLAFLLPVWGVVAIWIKMVSPGRAFYRQTRIGYKGEAFMIYKFRSMHENVDTEGHEQHVADLVKANASMTKLDEKGDTRLIPGGSFLRRSGLDELPQLINVWRGEMSFVGPRPCLKSEYDLYTPAQKARFNTPPGLTGYWQVHGKNSTTFDQMIKMDVHYVRNRSVWMDLGIILRTPLVLILQTMGRAPRVVLPSTEKKQRPASD